MNSFTSSRSPFATRHKAARPQISLVDHTSTIPYFKARASTPCTRCPVRIIRGKDWVMRDFDNDGWAHASHFSEPA